jgi:hypothetical protein
MKKITVFIISILLVVGIFASSHIGRLIWIKYLGISIKPLNENPIIEVDYFLQDDPKWSKDKIGTSQYSFANSGCLVASIASSVNHFGKHHTPQTINQAFTLKKIYNPQGEIIWYRIKDAIESIDYEYKKIFGARTIEEDLKQKELPIVKVRYLKYGVFHWVLIVGSTKNDFLIMDPLEQSKRYVPLSKHGKVYAYRKLVIKN